MKLYEIPKGSKLKVENMPATFHHLDGAYSYCTFDDEKENNVFHLFGDTEMELEDGWYVTSEL